MQQFASFVAGNWELFLALAVILILLIYPTINGRLRGFQEVEPVDAVLMINQQGAKVVDVREDAEYHGGHIINAAHVPLGVLPQRMKELEKFKGKPIIVGCRSGSRSARACAMLRKEGFEDVYNLKGGIMAWQNAGLPVSKD